MTKGFLKKVFLFFTAITVAVVAGAQQVQSLTIKEALDYAHKNNARIKNALLDVEVQLQTNKSLTAQALPTLSGSATLTDYFKTPVQPVSDFITPAIYGVLAQQGVKDANGNPILVPTTPADVFSLSFYQKYNANAALNLQQTIFDGTVFIGLKARALSVSYAQKAVDITEENIRVNIYKVYYQLVVSRTQMDQIDSNIARAGKLLHDADALHKNGFAEQLDVDKATVQLANLETQRISTQTTIDNGYLGLKYLIGMPVKDSLVLTDNFTEDDIKSGVLEDTSYRYEDRNDYQGLSLEKRLDEYNVKRYKFAYYPKLSVNGSFQKNAFSNTLDIFGKGGTWYTTSYAGISLSVPIFSGFSKDADLKKSRIQLAQVQNNIDYLKISIDNDIVQSQNSFRSAVLIVDNQRKNKTLAESVYNQTKKKYESGLASNTDITNAQNDLITAQTNYVNALYQAVIAKIDYRKATGKL